jgi:hypothetical protein
VFPSFKSATRIDIYADIEALEIAFKDKFNLGKLCVIIMTNNFITEHTNNMYN